MAQPDYRDQPPRLDGVYSYLIALAIVAAVSVGTLYASGFALLYQSTRQTIAATPGSRQPSGSIGIVSVRPTAGDRIPRQADRERTASARGATGAGIGGSGPVPIGGPLAQARAPTPAIVHAATRESTKDAHGPRPQANAKSPQQVVVKPRSEARPVAAEASALLRRGDEILRLGDIASARLYYERAADLGAQQAAYRMAATFDPAFLSQIGAQGMQGDPVQARHWYDRAQQLDAAENLAVKRAATD
jgi:hypothetical protein